MHFKKKKTTNKQALRTSTINRLDLDPISHRENVCFICKLYNIMCYSVNSKTTNTTNLCTCHVGCNSVNKIFHLAVCMRKIAER